MMTYSYSIAYKQASERWVASHAPHPPPPWISPCLCIIYIAGTNLLEGIILISGAFFLHCLCVIIVARTGIIS